ncbi:MAG TPA: CHAD domain-containing protein [Euzebyales bacterium]|nr:CHAD domain-containing protein [Euzebyales bacterium]
MSYRLHRDESLPIGVRRIAHELVDECIVLLDDPGDDVEEAVHEVRKFCKKLRGLLRLVRPSLGEAYRPANVTFRDAARQISSIRDAHALLETFDDLVAALHASGTDVRSIDDRDIGGAFLEVRGGLAARASAASESVAEGDERIAAARELIVEGSDQIDAWPLSNDVEVLKGGLAKTYRRGRRRLRECLFHPTDERLHQWRKRAKYTWYHLRLLGDAAPSVLQPLIGRFHDLSDVLGDDHDLAVLVAVLRDQPDEFGGDEAVETTVPVVETVRKDLQQRALRLGPRLYAEQAGAFATRVVAYWSAWQEHGDEWAAGEIADLAPADDDLEERSARQLYAIARELNVPGRSGMDRDGLISSIRAAGWVAPATT